VSETEKRATRGSRFLGVGLALTAITVLIACAEAPIEPTPLPPSFRLAVLDFKVPADWRDPVIADSIKKERQGWWFGSRDVWHNPGMGRLAGDLFAHELNKLSFVRVVPRSDIKYYIANKRELVRRKLDEKRRVLADSPKPEDRALAEHIQKMTDADYDREVENLSPREIGRELKVDRVLIGQIHNLYLAHNRTIDWFWSSVDLEVNLLDVDSGKVIWPRRARFKKNLVLTAELLEIAAQQMVAMMKRELFFQP